MSEKYFEYILILIFGISILLPLFGLYINIKLKHLQKLARLRIMKRQQKNENKVLFSSFIINRACQLLIFSFDKKGYEALAFLAVGRTGKAEAYFKKNYPKLSALLKAHINAETVYKKMLKQTNYWLCDETFSTYLPIISQLLFDVHNCHKFVTKINPKHLTKESTAYYNYIAAYAYLYDADMLSASQRASAALDYFKKKKYSFECASTYLLLGEIYRLSCVNDVAQTMIEAALKINQQQKMPLLKAKSLTSLGMLMLFENRLEESEDKYNQALQLPITQSLKADIHNQKALLALAQNDNSNARKHALQALNYFKLTDSKHGMALSLQLLAQICFNNAQFGKTLQYAEQAEIIYTEQQNYSAQIECMYLQAVSLFRLNKSKKSEKLLRNIIDTDKKYRHNFHIANAYSLLGLIYLQKNELQRAKVLFQQSLHLEQRNQRCEGLISDYANIALVHALSGQKSEAKENMKTAMQYAAETGNQELIELIKKKYNDYT